MTNKILIISKIKQRRKPSKKLNIAAFIMQAEKEKHVNYKATCHK